MKLNVKVGGETFEVEIEDLLARPIRARVGGEVFEVWPEALETTPAAKVAVPAAPQPRAYPNGAAQPAAATDLAVLAPLPGVIVSMSVQSGDHVTAGQPLCVLEAMKMNNTLRAARAGRIAAVRVTAGQTVRHRQVLLEYDPAPPEQP
jgi:biotin carboxyl carrier protein